MSNREVTIKSPYGCWRLEDANGSVLTIPNGITGRERDDGYVEFFNGRVLLRIPTHWRELIPSPSEAAPASAGKE